jgi:hypothetical protein
MNFFIARIQTLVNFNRSTQRNTLSIPPPLPQVIMILIAPNVHARVRADPVIRKLIISW